VRYVYLAWRAVRGSDAGTAGPGSAGSGL
jgi:hypothetical protein